MIGYMEMPLNFRYREVFLKGKPRHERFDNFLIKHPHMDVGHRAKIFAPFDALKGFDEAIAEKTVRYHHKKELNAEDTRDLDRKLRVLHHLTNNGSAVRQHPVTITVTYFQLCQDSDPDSYGNENGQGLYRSVKGICQKVDPYVTHTIQVGEKRIAFDDILSIEGESIFDKQSEWDLSGIL